MSEASHHCPKCNHHNPAMCRLATEHRNLRALAVQLAKALGSSELHGTEKYEWQKNRRVVLDAARKAGLVP